MNNVVFHVSLLSECPSTVLTGVRSDSFVLPDVVDHVTDFLGFKIAIVALEELVESAALLVG